MLHLFIVGTSRITGASGVSAPSSVMINHHLNQMWEGVFVRMRILLGLGRGLAFLYLCGVGSVAFGCDQLPAGQAMWIRLAIPFPPTRRRLAIRVRAVLTQERYLRRRRCVAHGHARSMAWCAANAKWDGAFDMKPPRLELEFDRGRSMKTDRRSQFRPASRKSKTLASRSSTASFKAC